MLSILLRSRQPKKDNKMKHTGGCHCGAVRYEAEADINNVISCNCSICIKKGSLLAFVPEAHFELKSGADVLSDYQFNHKRIHHLFCKNCGIASFGKGTTPDGNKMIAINARCLDDIDLSALSVMNYDGKSL